MFHAGVGLHILQRHGLHPSGGAVDDGEEIHVPFH
jgi:hypothetical protein